MGLPLSPLAYFLVRLPLISILEPALLGVTQENPNGAVSRAVRDGVRLLYAPLTVEPSKLLPWLVLLMIGVLHKPTREQLVPVALTIGAAFAVGEFWLVAYLIAAKPDPALSNRLLAPLGLAIGMILHYFGNAPIVLMHPQAFGLSTAVMEHNRSSLAFAVRSGSPNCIDCIALWK